MTPSRPTLDARYRLLDAWRGVACLLVVVYHAGFAIDRAEVVDRAGSARWLLVALLRMGSLGVPFFFVISGYCIAVSAEANRAKGLSPRAFLGRRFWRIYPAYWVALVGVVLLVAGLDGAGLGRWHEGVNPALDLASPGSLGPAQWVGNLSLTETWRPLVWGPADNEPFTRVAWTLCHEEQFYFLCFVVLAVAPRRFGPAMGVVTAAVLLARVWAWRAGELDRVAGTFVVHWHEFAAGLAVYWRLNAATGVIARRGVEAGLVAMLAVGLAWSDRATIGAAAFALALIPLRSRDAWAESSAMLRLLGECGRRCYSIYLVHLPVCTVVVAALGEAGVSGVWARALVTVPVASTLATAAGWLFFDLVEARFRPPPSKRQADPAERADGRTPAPAPALAG